MFIPRCKDVPARSTTNDPIDTYILFLGGAVGGVVQTAEDLSLAIATEVRAHFSFI
jgi:hypothetical protein